jgi:hypothetical protein
MPHAMAKSAPLDADGDGDAMAKGVHVDADGDSALRSAEDNTEDNSGCDSGEKNVSTSGDEIGQDPSANDSSVVADEETGEGRRSEGATSDENVKPDEKGNPSTATSEEEHGKDSRESKGKQYPMFAG